MSYGFLCLVNRTKKLFLSQFDQHCVRAIHLQQGWKSRCGLRATQCLCRNEATQNAVDEDVITAGRACPQPRHSPCSALPLEPAAAHGTTYLELPFTPQLYIES